MKIGLITYPLNNNYGNILQAYALLFVLKSMGHEAWIIDIQPYHQDQGIFEVHFNAAKLLIKKYILRRNVLSIYPSKIIRQLELDNKIAGANLNIFTDKYLTPKLSPIYTSKEVKYLQDNFRFDAFIAGSDQIWNPKYMMDLIKTTYFDFLEYSDIKKIVYAASFGSDTWEYDSRLTKECGDLAKKISAISVREESGIQLCRNYLGVEAQCVLDPTFLLEKDKYIDIIDNYDVRLEQKVKLFTYILDETDEKNNLIEFVSNNLGLTISRMGLKRKNKSLTDKIMEPVENWLRSFNEAKFVITDSFHGTVFSLIFNKPFITIGNPSRGNSRLLSLLNKLSLQDRFINFEDQSSFNKVNTLINNQIDWNETNQRINSLKISSLDFIDKALNNHD